ncbi:hypothetical protein CHL78_012070 [Romboutsia weinsteinii]|uniref:Uncharacterized protein n=1 Tax=Romboutsia weinsteinii TaxID=2020949 RepID=A0A371J1Z7_9FIRM|nr:hypothetical protein [Romboutsia weinsteinii]RDY26800.1 hypothetical protein CHL78_012070 [Romboutsia weinsteinii]
MASIGGIRGSRYRIATSRKDRYPLEIIKQWAKNSKRYIEDFDILFEFDKSIYDGNLIIIKDGEVRLEPIPTDTLAYIKEIYEIEKCIKIGRAKEPKRMHNTRELYLFIKKSKQYTVDDLMWILGLDKASSVYCLGNPKREVSRKGYISLLRIAYELGFTVHKDELHYVLE